VPVIQETPERTTTSAVGVVAALAGPSQGSDQVATWRIAALQDVDSPVHEIDRDQVWMPISGTFEFELDVDGATTVEKVDARQAMLVPATVARRFRAVGGPAEALVAMPADGTAGVPGQADRHPLPWAR
jgi:mannose-6-phosphate isomerase-like protein (cupin superfamily)